MHQLLVLKVGGLKFTYVCWLICLVQGKSCFCFCSFCWSWYGTLPDLTLGINETGAMRSLKLFVILKCVVELYLLCLADFCDLHFFLGDICQRYIFWSCKDQSSHVWGVSHHREKNTGLSWSKNKHKQMLLFWRLLTTCACGARAGLIANWDQGYLLAPHIYMGPGWWRQTGIVLYMLCLQTGPCSGWIYAVLCWILCSNLCSWHWGSPQW